MSIPQTLSRERFRWHWSHRFQVLLTVGIILLAGDSLLNLAQVTRGKGLPLLTVWWEVLKWTMVTAAAALLASVFRLRRDLSERLYSLERFAPVESSESERIDQLYAELRPLMSRAASDPTLKEEVQAKLSLLRQLQSEEADEMEKRFEAGLLLKSGEGWQALKRADEFLARYENPSSPNAPTEPKN